MGLAVCPFCGGIHNVGADRVDVLDPQRRCAVQKVVKYGHGNENVGCGSALKVELLAFLVSWRVHGGREVDHPCEDGLDEGVVQQIHRETDAAKEVEDWGCEDLAGPGREEDAKKYGGCTNMVPVATNVGLLHCDALHDLLHDMRPVGVLGAVLRVSGDEHANDDHDGRDGRREDRGRGVLVMVVEFGDEHSRDDVQTLEGTNCETCTC